MTDSTKNEDKQFSNLPLDKQLELIVGPRKIKDKISHEGVPYSAESIIDQNKWNRFVTKGLFGVLALLTVAVVVVALVLAMVSTRPPVTLTYSIDNSGNIVQLKDVKLPGITDAALLDWSVGRAMDIHKLSFHDWQGHVESMKSFFTEKGHLNYQLALKNSDLFKRITENRQVSWAEPTEAPTITEAKAVNGVWTWYVTMKFNVYIGGGNQSTLPVPIESKMIIQRTSRAINNYGLVIAQYLAKVNE